MLNPLFCLKAIALSTLCILSLSPVPTALRTLAQTLPSQTPEVMPPLDPDDKPPTLPAGPRDECLTGENSPSLIPLLPDLNQKIGLTVSPHPSIFVYIPQTLAETALFVLIDEQRDRIYSQAVPLEGTPGILSITVPEDANIPPLEPNQTYSWTLALLCPTTAGIREANIYVTGRIQRVENLELAQQVSQATPQHSLTLRPSRNLARHPPHPRPTAPGESRRYRPNRRPGELTHRCRTRGHRPSPLAPPGLRLHQPLNRNLTFGSTLTLHLTGPVNPIPGLRPSHFLTNPSI